MKTSVWPTGDTCGRAYSTTISLVRHRDEAYQDGHSIKDFGLLKPIIFIIPGQQHDYGHLEPLHAGELAHFVVGRVNRRGA